MEKDLANARQIHMIGIGGAGMCALARIFLQMGYRVTGSDNNESDNLARIRKEGALVHMGHAPDQLEGADLVVYSAAILPDNPELLEAKKKGMAVMTRAQALGELSRMHRQVVAVSGTHGKTTTTSMICEILCHAGRNFTAVVGGYLPCLGGNGRLGAQQLMVCEACEFADTYLSLKRDTAVVLNIDEDHLEFFKTPQRLKASFRQFAQGAKTILACGDDLRTCEALEGLSCVKFGLGPENDLRAQQIEQKQGRCCFDLYGGTKRLMHLALQVAGKHQVYNALAAAAVAMREGVDPTVIEEALGSFRGAARRFEVIAQAQGITIADDYAHHPTEIEATLHAARQMGFERIIAVFQPFTFSRTALLMDDFAQVLSRADRVVLTPIMGSREINTYGVSAQQLCERIPAAVLCNDFEQTALTALALARPGDLILTLGCGDIYKAARIMERQLKGQTA